MQTILKVLFALFIPLAALYAQVTPGAATATLKEAYIPLPGGGKAIYGSGGTLSYYQREDGMGNVRIISTPTGTLSSSVEIAPFGEDYDDNLLSGFTDFSFSNMGQESGTAGGVAAGYGAPYVTPNRRYSAVQGRWLSPDPIVGDNAYVYASNEPTIKSDPSGLQDGGDDCDDCLVFDSGDDGDDDSVGWGPDGGGYGAWGSWGWGWFGGIWSQGPGGRNLKSLYSSEGYSSNRITASLMWSVSAPMFSQSTQNSNAFPEIMATLVWWGMSASMSSQGTRNFNVVAANTATISAGTLDQLNDYCSARGRARFIADWVPGGGTMARTLWGSNNGAQLGFYQLSTADLNNITGENSGGQTVALHAASEGLKTAAGSTAFLSWFRGATDVPKTLASTWLGRLSLALIVADASSGFYKEGKEILNCQAGN